MVKHETIRDSLAKIFEGIKQLRIAFPLKEFTIDGRLVGDIGEAIVQRDYDVELYTTLVEGYDGITSDGKRVQIKATFKDLLTFKKTPDYYIGIKINEDGPYKEIFNGPGQLIEEKYKHRKNFGKKLLAFPNAALAELSLKASDQRISRRLIDSQPINEESNGDE